MNDEIGLKIIGKKALTTAFGRVIFTLSSYSFLIIRARLLGSLWLGIYVLGMVSVRALAAVARIGMNTSLIYFVSIYKSTHDHVQLRQTLKFSLFFSFIAGSIAAVLLWVVSEPLSLHVFHNPDLSAPLKLFSLLVPLLAMWFIAVAVFRGLRDVRTINIILIAPQILALCFFLIFIRFFHLAIFACIWALIVSYSLTVVAGLFKIAQKFSFLQAEQKPFWNVGEKILSYSYPLIFVESMRVIFSRVDTVMIGYFLSEKYVGLYSPAVQLSLMVSFSLFIFNQPFAATIAEYYHNKKMAALSYLYKHVTRLAFTAAFLLFLFIIVSRRELMMIFGKEYLEATAVVCILAAGQLVNVLVGSVCWMLSMTGHQKNIFYLMIISNICNIILNFFLIPLYGIVGAAVATATSIVLLNVTALLSVFRFMKMHPFSITFYKPLLSGLISYGLLYFITRPFTPFPNIIKLLLNGICCFILFNFIHYFLKYEATDRMLMKAILFRCREFFGIRQ